MYAHLSRVLAAPGEQVTVGTLLGLVGATGEATGPHLHFEVRVRDAAVDPLPALR
jgi:murein DD-endopeptidase MepM/ murein hydrolase activator NlpD